MTAVQADVDQLQHLDFTPDCQNAGCEDDHPPAKYVVTLVCGCTIPCCTPCALSAIQAKARNRLAARAICCNCRRTFTNIRTGQLYVSIQPL